jgi:5-methylcytosine-specific restriction endonuclease McrA
VKLVRQRDNHTCQLCGKGQVKPGLHVHHIVPDRLFAPDDWQSAHDFGNLISLCPTCHRHAESDPKVNALFLANREVQQLQFPF